MKHPKYMIDGAKKLLAKKDLPLRDRILLHNYIHGDCSTEKIARNLKVNAKEVLKELLAMRRDNLVFYEE